MGFFSSKIKAAIKTGKQVQKRNVLEAIVAASLLVAASDGDISKGEVNTLNELLANNDSLKAFKPKEISDLTERYSNLLTAGYRVGKVKMLREIEDIANDENDAEEVFATAITIAEQDGDISEKELGVLREIGTKLGQRLADFGL